MTQSRLSFDLPRAEAHKRQGMDAAATYRQGLLARAKLIAKQLATDGRSITIDDVVEALAIASDAPQFLGNSSGSVFSGSEWSCCGFTPSTRISNHGRIVRMWRLK